MKNDTTEKLIFNEEGMTLIEILIVIALIAMVGSFVGVKVLRQYDNAKVDATKIQMRNLGPVLDMFKRDCGFYPLTDQGLDALAKKPQGRECKNYDPEGYTKKVPKDGWDRDFQYTSDGNTYQLKSLGQDGAEGGTDVNKDISTEDIQ